MNRGLDAVVAALSELRDAELRTLIELTGGNRLTTPWLLAWIEDACDWELNRRRGWDYPLLAPHRPASPEEAIVGVKDLAAIRGRLAFDLCERPEPVISLFTALFELLSDETDR